MRPISSNTLYKLTKKENVKTGNVETGTVQPFKPIIFQWSFEHLKHVRVKLRSITPHKMYK